MSLDLSQDFVNTPNRDESVGNPSVERNINLLNGDGQLNYSPWQNEFGGAIGPFLAGYIFDVTGSYQLAFFVSAALSIVGLMLAAALRAIKSPEVKT